MASVDMGGEEIPKRSTVTFCNKECFKLRTTVEILWLVLNITASF